MTDTLPNLDKDSKPIFHFSPRPLLELTSMKMAFDIWLQMSKTYANDKIRFCQLVLQSNVKIDTKMLAHVPCKIRHLIEVEFYQIALSLLEVESDRNIRTRWNLVAFGSEGRINFKQTISNFLYDESLDNITKFRMACQYCREEEIDLLWPLVYQTLNVDCMRFGEDILLYYWICRKRDELHRIPLGATDITRFMFDQCRLRSKYWGVQYFLALFNPRFRFAKTMELYYNIFEADKYVRLLPNFDAAVQRHIIGTYPERILCSLVTNYEPIEYCVQCWLFIVDNVPLDLFESLIEDIIDKHLCPRRNLMANTDFRYRHIETVLEEIWLHTPDRLKKSPNFGAMKILKKYHSYHTCHFPSNFDRDTFLFSMLSDIDVQLRKEVWNFYRYKWLEGMLPIQFDQFMRKCLVNTEDIEDFVRNLPDVPEFQKYHDDSVRQGLHNKLDELLSLLYSSRDRVLKIKKELLANGVRIVLGIGFRKIAQWQACVSYIDNLFDDDRVSADFKDQLIFSDEVFNMLLDRERVYGNIDNVNVIVPLLVSPRKLAEIKSKFFRILRDRITGGDLLAFDGSRCREFLMWYLDDDEQRMDDFKKSLQIDLIFDTTWFANFTPAVCLDTLKRNHAANTWMSAAAKFLMWYFNSESEADEFLRKKLESYRSSNQADVWRFCPDDENSSTLYFDSIINKMRSIFRKA